jgi:alanine-synthesizing transaminase
MFANRTNWNLTPNALSAALEAHRKSGLPFLDLTLSNPTQCGFSYDSATILRALSQPASLEYSPIPNGLLAAREAVARYCADHHCTVPVNDILLATGTSEAYSFAFRLLCNPGDEVLIPAPSYPLLDFLADIHDVRLVRYPLLYDHGWLIDFHALERAITPKTRGVILVHPNNPTGHFCSLAKVRQLNEICASRHLALIVDEVFLDFSLGSVPPSSFAANSSALTFTLSGISKICGLPQMKLAWMIVSGPETKKRETLERLEVISDAYLSMNTPIQLAASALLETRRAFQKQLLERVKSNLAELDRQLIQQKSCSRLECQGGWNAVLRVPATHSDEELAIELLNTKHVYAHPGHFYDFAGDGHLVISLILPQEKFSEGVRSLLEFF